MVEENRAASANGSGRNPYVFVVGCERSGTTLLKRMIDAHPAIAMLAAETHWIPRFYEKRTGLTPEDQATPELVARLAEYWRFPTFNIDREELEKLISIRHPITYADFVSGFFDLYAQSQGKRIVGDKTPNYVQDIPLLHGLWPKARFVHLIRDGRDVGLAIMNWNKKHKNVGRIATWSEDPVSTIALFWSWQVELGLQHGRPLGPELYYEIRYEELVRNPEAECAALCEFLSLPCDDAMVRYHEGRTKTDPRLSANNAWLPPTQGLRDWRSQMPAEDLKRFEAVAGDVLVELGYSLGAPRASPRAQEHAARMRNMFNRRPLPQSWRGARQARAVGQESVAAADAGTEGLANRPGRNPYVFIVGCPRSGTTLLKRMIDAHPQINITRETHWIPRFYKKRIGLTPEGWVTRELIAKLLEYYRFPRLKIDRKQLETLIPADGQVSYANFVSGLFDLLGTRARKSFVGDKTPEYVREIPLLNSLFPQVKFVHIIRDGRDVALSALDWAHRNKHSPVHRFELARQEPVAVCAMWWARFVGKGRRDGNQFDTFRYHEVHYEDLVAQSEQALRQVSDFLELPYAPEMLTFNKGKIRDGPNLSSKKRWLPPTQGLRDWRSQMALRDVALFEALAGDLLSELGYETGATAISDEVAEVAERCRAWWQTEMARKA